MNDIKTAYPEIYRHVYWSGFKHDDDDVYADEIIDNRNNFIERYNIVKVDTSRTLQYISDKMHSASMRADHLELYRDDSGGAILLNSPYAVEECPGMEPYAKMYHVNANTFIQHFASLYDARQWAKNLTN
jgi:hypothetical protein